jgi:hypothetical protein
MGSACSTPGGTAGKRFVEARVHHAHDEREEDENLVAIIPPNGKEHEEVLPRPTQDVAASSLTSRCRKQSSHSDGVSTKAGSLPSHLRHPLPTGQRYVFKAAINQPTNLDRSMRSSRKENDSTFDSMTSRSEDFNHSISSWLDNVEPDEPIPCTGELADKEDPRENSLSFDALFRELESPPSAGTTMAASLDAVLSETNPSAVPKGGSLTHDCS